MDDELRKAVKQFLLAHDAYGANSSIKNLRIEDLRAALAKNANAAPSKAKPVAVAHMGGMEHGPVEIRVTPYGFDTLRNGRTNLYTLSALKAKNTSAAPQDQDAKCEWSKDKDGDYVATCHKVIWSIADTDDEPQGWLTYCYGCGKPIKFIDADMDGDKNAG